MNKKYFSVLTIAGSDSSGGAGIQADIKTIFANGCYAASVITALTAQNTQGVSAIYPVSAEFVAAQLEAVLQDLTFDAIKIGMLPSAAIMLTVINLLRQYAIKNIVLDPVMQSKHKTQLMPPTAVNTLQQQVLPFVDLITPNLMEAEILIEEPITSLAQMQQTAQLLANQYKTNVLLKGGHFQHKDCADVLFAYQEQTHYWFTAERIITKNTHGTGCTLSAAIAAFLARGETMLQAITQAKTYLTQAIAAGSEFAIGKGNGPVHHAVKL